MFSVARIATKSSRNFKQIQSLSLVQRQTYATIKYTKDHEWVRFESGKSVVGISDEAQQKLGEIVHVELSVKVSIEILIVRHY